MDDVAGAGATVLLCNTNARRTNYRSRVWDAFWDGHDPAASDDQPFLAPVPRNQVVAFRRLIDNMLAVDGQGIDYPARVIQRCRHDHVSPWISLRMNDCHNNNVANHPFHGSFWKKNPQWRIEGKDCPSYFATCLDYAHREVRDFYMALIDETLERYDIDGLELDFMREPYLFSAGKEAEGAAILTGWLREVRRRVDGAAAKQGHSIRLGVRVPSTPEAALGLGLDVPAWAKQGLVNLLVVAPRWATLAFDMPIERWRGLLGTSKTALAGGLEVRYQPYRHGPWRLVSPELAAGAAVAALSQGADAVYLFNYFPPRAPSDWWSLPVYQSTLKAMASLDSLEKMPRRVGVTFRDVTAPGEKYQPPLPATGGNAAFSLNLGPVPSDRWLCDLVIEYSSGQGDRTAAPKVFFDGGLCDVRSRETTKDGCRVVSYAVSPPMLTRGKIHEIKVVAEGPNVPTIQAVEAWLREPDGEGGPAPRK